MAASLMLWLRQGEEVWEWLAGFEPSALVILVSEGRLFARVG